MTDTIIGAFIGVGGAIIGALATYLLSLSVIKRTHDDAINLIQRQEFNKAATEFRNAFLCEIIFLKHNARLPECERTYTTLNEFLQAGYIFRHLKALEVFKTYLTTYDKIAIDKAWKEYCCHSDNQNSSSTVAKK